MDQVIMAIILLLTALANLADTKLPEAVTMPPPAITGFDDPLFYEEGF